LKLRGLLRNACIVTANEGCTELTPQLTNLARSSAEPLVRAHAVWALRRLQANSELESIRTGETEAQVLAEFEGAV
ncbi:MAG: epoxyqueuosine reductase, partial [Verrucomicrobiia bacterium]